jgi:hypothetical protein
VRSFELRGNEGVLRLEGEPPKISAPYFAWDYDAQLKGHSLQVALRVADDEPMAFVDFFEAIAQSWRGWLGERGYESLDRSLSIVASHDGVRSVVFSVTCRADAGSGFDWSATQLRTRSSRPGCLG